MNVYLLFFKKNLLERKRIPKKFKTCNCHAVKKTILFFFFFLFELLLSFWIKDEFNFAIKRQNWSWLRSSFMKFLKLYDHESMKVELMTYINNALKVKVSLWQFFVNFWSVFIFYFTVREVHGFSYIL